MRGLAGYRDAFQFDSTQCRKIRPAHSLLKHCNAARFEYEHKPVFEEGQKLSSSLLDSLLSTDKERLRSPIVADDASKQLRKKKDDTSKQLWEKNAGSTPRSRHKRSPEDKRCSVREKIAVLKISKDSNDNIGDGFVNDSDLFSFDDVPMYEEDDDDASDAIDDADDLDEMLEPSKSRAGKRLGWAAIDGNLGIACQAEQELQLVPHDVSINGTVDFDLLSLHGSNFASKQSNPLEVSMQRSMHPQNSMLPTKALQRAQSLSELLSFRDMEINGNDAHSEKHNFKGQCLEDTYDFCHDAAACASHEKGNSPSQQDNFDDDAPSHPLGRAFNSLCFARTYNLVALQVSLAECERLAYRFKGHLLNWPRIGNIARVEGDDMDWDNMSSWPDGKKGREAGAEDQLLQAVYGSAPRLGQMMKRAKSAKKLSSCRLAYLDCISRLGRKALKEIKEERERQSNTHGHHSRKYYMVELGNSSAQNEEPFLDSGLPFGSSMNRWRGPFRLLLLDPKYAGQAELPMAIQMLLNECPDHGKRGPRREIVPCKLTLFYKYWSMEEIINFLLPSGESLLLPISVLGHVAVLHLGEQFSSVRFLIGKVILDKHRPKVKTVINKTEPVEGRGHPSLEVLAGNNSLVTSIIENDMKFLVNLATVHWDSELAAERQRLIQKFSSKDIICDVYAGAGALALSSAKKVWRVFANDPNSDALKYLARNVDDNKVNAKVELYNLDSSMFVRTLLAFKRPVLMTQIVFSLPTSAETVIDALKGAFNRKTWPANQRLPSICIYGYSDTQHRERDFVYLIVNRLGLASEAVEFFPVKPLDCRRCLMCAIFQLPETLAFDDR